MARPHGSRPVPVGEVLRASVRELGWERRLAEEEVLARWPAAVGPRVAAHARAARLSGGRLTVVASSSVWAQQLSLLRTELLQRVAERCGEGLVREIFVVTGPVEAPAPEPGAAPVAAPGTAPPLAELPEEIAREVAAIPDGPTREAVGRTVRLALANPRAEGATAPAAGRRSGPP